MEKNNPGIKSSLFFKLPLRTFVDFVVAVITDFAGFVVAVITDFAGFVVDFVVVDFVVVDFDAFVGEQRHQHIPITNVNEVKPLAVDCVETVLCCPSFRNPVVRRIRDIIVNRRVHHLPQCFDSRHYMIRVDEIWEYAETIDPFTQGRRGCRKPMRGWECMPC